MHNEEMQVNMEALGGHCYFCSVAFSYDHEKKKNSLFHRSVENHLIASDKHHSIIMQKSWTLDLANNSINHMFSVTIVSMMMKLWPPAPPRQVLLILIWKCFITESQ